MMRKDFSLFQSSEFKNMISKLMVSAMTAVFPETPRKEGKDPMGMTVKLINVGRWTMDACSNHSESLHKLLVNIKKAPASSEV